MNPDVWRDFALRRQLDHVDQRLIATCSAGSASEQPSSFQIGVSREQRMASSGMLVLFRNDAHALEAALRDLGGDWVADQFE